MSLSMFSCVGCWFVLDQDHATEFHWMCMDHLVPYQLLSMGVLTIMDTSYDKNMYIIL